jgi:hypothetical protein
MVLISHVPHFAHGFTWRLLQFANKKLADLLNGLETNVMYFSNYPNKKQGTNDNPRWVSWNDKTAPNPWLHETPADPKWQRLASYDRNSMIAESPELPKVTCQPKPLSSTVILTIVCLFNHLDGPKIRKLVPEAKLHSPTGLKLW